MKIFNSLLTPYAMYSEENNTAPRLAIMGTCVSDHLVKVADSKNFKIDHYLLDTWPCAPIPDIPLDSLDGVIIHLTLRHILDTVSGFGRGDVSYIDSPIGELTHRAAEIMKEKINVLTNNFSGKVPLFFLSFIEPIQTTKGFFHNNRSDSVYRLVRNLNDIMSEHLSNINGSYYTEVNDIFSYYGLAEISDSYQFFFTHSGNIVVENEKTDYSYLTIIQRIVNAIETLRAINPIKLIITDLDNTLWMGVPAEEDEIVPHVHFSGWPIGYVESLLECKRRGIALAICSKNSESITVDNFHKIWRDVIKLEDFFSVKINWNPKSENIREIMKEANILPSNTLFIDDNPIEIDEVKSAFPEIRTLSLPQNLWRNYLLHAPQTQSVLLTEESRHKTKLLRAKVEREQMSTSMDRDLYLHSLKLKARLLVIRGREHPKFSRSIELLNKTNQFNTTGRRWEENELTERLYRNELVIYAANIEDRLANHGLTALAVVSGNEIIQFVLSCRIFGLGIETALLSEVINSLRNNGAEIILAHLKDTGRNATCRDFYSKHAFSLISGDPTCEQIWASKAATISPSWIEFLPEFEASDNISI